MNERQLFEAIGRVDDDLILAADRPAVRRQPARCRRPPPEGQPAALPKHSLGAGNPDCRGRLSRFAVKKCATPRGDQIPGHDG